MDRLKSIEEVLQSLEFNNAWDQPLPVGWHSKVEKVDETPEFLAAFGLAPAPAPASEKEDKNGSI